MKIWGDFEYDFEAKTESLNIGHSISKAESWFDEIQAANLIMDYGFNNLGLERITANTLEQNKAARRSLEKNGFVLEGTERRAVYFAGQKWDRLNYAILREEFNR